MVLMVGWNNKGDVVSHNSSHLDDLFFDMQFLSFILGLGSMTRSVEKKSVQKHGIRHGFFSVFGAVSGLGGKLLMVLKSGDHQLRLVVYSIIYKVLYIQGGCL